LTDSERDNPLELTISTSGTPGRVTLHLEDRDAGTSTNPLVLNMEELRAALALVTLPQMHYVED
jgi:hypothetical protein